MLFRPIISSISAPLFDAKKHGDSPLRMLRRYPGAPFGEGGVLHRMGTDHGRRAWVNPHTDGRVVAAMSSVRGSGSAPHKFVGRSDDGACETHDIPNSWMPVDLGADRTVVPTHYCLRHDGVGHLAARNWALEGKAADGGDWQEIRRHDNDATLARQDYAVGASLQGTSFDCPLC